jgi:hypothetical protein
MLLFCCILYYQVDKGVSHILQYLKDRLPIGTTVRQPAITPPTLRLPVPQARQQQQQQQQQQQYESTRSNRQSPYCGSADALQQQQQQELPEPPASALDMQALEAEIDALQQQTEAPGLSQAKLFAVKKQLQLKRAQRIRESRRQQQQQR